MLPKKGHMLSHRHLKFLHNYTKGSLHSTEKIVLVGSGQPGRLRELLAYLSKIQHILKGETAAVIPFDKYKPNPSLFLQTSFAIRCSATTSLLMHVTTLRHCF